MKNNLKFISSLSIGLITVLFILLSLVGCRVIERINKGWESDDESWIVALDTTLYESIDDPSSSETIEVGTMVIKTGK